MKNFMFVVLFLATALGVSAQSESDTITVISGPKVESNTIDLPFGQLEKRRVVGAVDIISAEDINRSSEINLSSTLLGLSSGLGGNKWSGNPGLAGAGFKVRGRSRGGDGDQPLVIIDGISNRSLDNISIEDVESIQILKDVTAKMLYGSKAANGVIVVKTKRGYNGKRKLSFSGEYGVKTPTDLPKFINSHQYATAYNQARLNDGQPLNYLNPEKYLNPSMLYPDEDYYGTFLNSNAKFQRLNAQIVGGNERNNYFVNIGYVGEGGLESVGPGTTYDRLNIRSNVDFNVTDVVTVKLDVIGRIELLSRPNVSGNQLFNMLSSHRPNEYPFFVTNDGMMDLDSLGRGQVQSQNLYGELLRKGYVKESRFYAQTNFGMDFNLNKYIKGLTAGAGLTFDVNNTLARGKTLTYSSINPESGVRVGIDDAKPSEQKLGDDFTTNVGAIGNVNYANTFGKHGIQADLAYFFQVKSGKRTVNSSSSSQDDKNQNLGLRVNYAFDNKYVIEGSASLMGSDKFIAGNRFATFGAIGAAWNLSEEAFLKGVSSVSNLKLKASYGVMGYDRDYDYLLYRDEYFGGGAFYTGINNGADAEYGMLLKQMGNPLLTFEKSRELNIGLEGAFFKNKLSFEVNVFSEYRYDMPDFVFSTIPDYVGGESTFLNFNEVSNKGFELALSYTNTIGDLRYTIGGNAMMTEAINEKLDELFAYDHMYRTGTRTDAIWGLKSNGFYTSQDQIDVNSNYGEVLPGDLKYEDKVQDGSIDLFDNQVIGNSYHKISYALNAKFEYKGLSLYLLGQGISGNDQVSLWNNYNLNIGQTAKYSDRVLGAAVPTGTPAEIAAATYPRLTSLGSGHSYRSSSFWLENGAYFKLRVAELNYKLPESFLSSVAVSNANVFVRGTDLFRISKIKTLDPEDTNAGVSKYPLYSTVSFGVKIGF